MGFGDVFEKIFSQPEIARRGNAQNNTRRALANNILRTQAINEGLQSTFDPLQAAAAGTATDRARRRMGAAASSAIATQSPERPTSFRQALSDAERRSRARSQVFRQGEKAAQTQGLRDRMTVARRGLARRGRVTEGLASALNIREGVNLGVSKADALVAASRADLAGGILGGVTATLADPTSRQNIGNLFSNIFGGGTGGGTLTDVNVNPIDTRGLA